MLVNSILVLSANKIDVDLLFTERRKSFMSERNNKGPRMERCGTPCLINVQLACSNDVSYIPNSVSTIRDRFIRVLYLNQLFCNFLVPISRLHDLQSKGFFKITKYLLLLIYCSRHLWHNSLVYKWYFLLLSPSKIPTAPCIKYYYVNVLITLIALPFHKFFKIMLREFLPARLSLKN